MFTYLVFPRINAENFNANAGAYVAGVPQPTAICGLAHAFCLAWDAAFPGELATTFASVAYSVANFSGLQGQSRNPKSGSIQKSKVGASPGAAMLDRPRASMQFGLVLALKFITGTLPNQAGVVGRAAQILESLRLSGASLWVQSDPVFEDDKLTAVSRLAPDAFVLSDESGLLSAWLEQAPELAVSRAMADLCARPTDKEIFKPRYVPTVTGLNRLTAFSAMEGARNGYQHAYAEPVIGLGRFRALSAVKRALRSPATEGETEGTSLNGIEHTMPDGTVVRTEVSPAIFWAYALFPHGPELHLVQGHT